MLTAKQIIESAIAIERECQVAGSRLDSGAIERLWDLATTGLDPPSGGTSE